MKLFTPGLIRSEIIHSVKSDLSDFRSRTRGSQNIHSRDKSAESDLSDLVGASHLGVLALDTLLPFKLTGLGGLASQPGVTVGKIHFVT